MYVFACKILLTDLSSSMTIARRSLHSGFSLSIECGLFGSNLSSLSCSSRKIDPHKPTMSSKYFVCASKLNVLTTLADLVVKEMEPILLVDMGLYGRMEFLNVPRVYVRVGWNRLRENMKMANLYFSICERGVISRKKIRGNSMGGMGEG